MLHADAVDEIERLRAECERLRGLILPLVAALEVLIDVVENEFSATCTEERALIAKARDGA